MSNTVRSWSPPQIIWSALIAVTVWTAVGFNWFGPGFNWTTRLGASRLTAEAMTESLATICVAQANSPTAADALVSFAKVESWKRREFIESAGWSVMPGSESAESGVGDLCAKKLLAT